MGTIEREPEVIDNLTSTSTIDALSANQGKVLNDSMNRYIDIEFVPPSNIAAGTPGTRGWQGTYNFPYGIPKSIVVINIQNSVEAHPFVFYYNGFIYCNIYRGVATAISAASCATGVRVYY